MLSYQNLEDQELNEYLNRLEYISGEYKYLSKIDNTSVDYIVSNSVLQHVDDLDTLFGIMSNLLIPLNGVMYHRVDLRCMNKFKKYGELYFLTFNESMWRLMGDNIGQSNRKSIIDYYKLCCHLFFENRRY